MGEKLRTWQVEGVVQVQREGGKPWGQNQNLIVYALTLEEAVAAVRAKYPDITLIKVMGDRWAHDVIVVEPGREMSHDD